MHNLAEAACAAAPLRGFLIALRANPPRGSVQKQMHLKCPLPDIMQFKRDVSLDAPTFKVQTAETVFRKGSFGWQFLMLTQQNR